jgi:hypothetical protein
MAALEKCRVVYAHHTELHRKRRIELRTVRPAPMQSGKRCRIFSLCSKRPPKGCTCTVPLSTTSDPSAVPLQMMCGKQPSLDLQIGLCRRSLVALEEDFGFLCTRLEEPPGPILISQCGRSVSINVASPCKPFRKQGDDKVDEIHRLRQKVAARDATVKTIQSASADQGKRIADSYATIPVFKHKVKALCVSRC